MHRKKRILLVLTAAISISMLAVAGRIMGGHTETPHEITPEMPSAKSEYDRLMQRYMSKDSAVGLKGEVAVFDGALPTIVKEKSSFTYRREGTNFYSSLSFQQTFFDGEFMVQLDSLHKIVYITAAGDKGTTDRSTEQMSFLPDKLFSDTARFRMTGTVTGDDKLRTLTVTSDFNPEIQRFTLAYSPIDYTMKSAEIRFYKHHRPQEGHDGSDEDVWISRIDYKEAPAEKLDVRSMIQKIFVRRKNQLIPTSAYTDYRAIINNQQ